MTGTLTFAPGAGPGATPLAIRNLRPGIPERILTSTTIFVLVYGLPNRWMVAARADILGDGSNPLLTLAIFGLIGLALLRVAGSFDLLIAASKRDLLLLAFVGITLASTFWSEDPNLTARKSLEFALVTAFALYLVLRYELREIIVLAAVAHLVGGALNLSWVFAFPHVGIATSPPGWSGIFLHKNALGLQSPWNILLMLTAASAAPRHRFLFRAGAVLQLVLMVGSQSKTALVASSFAAVLLPVFHALRTRRTLPGAVLTGFFGSGLLTAAVATANLGRITEALGKDLTFTGRIPLWESLIPAALQRPALGYGFEAFFNGPFSPAHETWIEIGGWTAPHAHNAALEIVLELGVFALAVYLALFTRAVFRAVRHLRAVPGLVGLFPLAVVTLAFLMSISEAGVTKSPGTWLYFAVAVIAAGRYR